MLYKMALGKGIYFSDLCGNLEKSKGPGLGTE
jgi:hypothetical protein